MYHFLNYDLEETNYEIIRIIYFMLVQNQVVSIIIFAYFFEKLLDMHVSQKMTMKLQIGDVGKYLLTIFTFSHYYPKKRRINTLEFRGSPYSKITKVEIK